MAQINAFSVVPQLFVEERLMSALVTGPLEQSEGLLDSIEEVDAMIARQKTLLHVGVSLGKEDWVEELLARGANPDLEDSCHLTAISIAEEMLRKFPEDGNRRQVLRLVRLVNRRDRAMRRQMEKSSGRNAVSSIPVIQAGHMSAMTTLRSSLDALKEGMRSVRGELRSSLEELKEQVCGRDAPLHSFEAAVTSSVEELTSLIGRLHRETSLGASGATLEVPLPLSNMGDERRECVDAIIRRTEVVYGGKRGIACVRSLYERLYDLDSVTTGLLKYLCKESRFVVKVDCGFGDIRRMKKTFLDLDGREQSGSDWCSFAEFSTNTVYLGAIGGFWLRLLAGRMEVEFAEEFAMSLAQIALLLCFNNGGKPYEGGDAVHEAEWTAAFKEVEGKRRELSGPICNALNKSTQTAKESFLAASVPQVIVRYGSTTGTSMLRGEAPLLFKYYKEHVVASLLAKARD